MNSIDPNSSFERIYHSVRSHIEYSLVVVPADYPVRVEYRKGSCAIDISLEPDDDTDWNVWGQIDEDTFANLGFAVAQVRRGNNAPIVTAAYVAVARQHGIIEPIGQNGPGQMLFAITPRLQAQVIDKFMRSIWLPRRHEDYRLGRVPAIRVGYARDENRVLPQKWPLPQRNTKGAKLFVVAGT